MLKIVYPICCGMDVHKSFIVACIAPTNEQGVTTYKNKRFSTFTGDLRRCVVWLAENNCKNMYTESTGKYWIPVYNILEPTCNIVLAHPKYMKAIRGKKTDRRDAKWIADIFKHDLVSGSFMPPADIRQLRDLVRYRWKLTNFTTGEKNRAQNCLTVSNFKLDDSQMCSKWCLNYNVSTFSSLSVVSLKIAPSSVLFVGHQIEHHMQDNGGHHAIDGLDAWGENGHQYTAAPRQN